MKELPINIQDFEILKKEDRIYVDKTALIHQLIRQKANFFLSRPRRFGKSLLVSTIKAIFQGKQNLFIDLAINKIGYTWPVHPIIALDFSTFACGTPEELKKSLCADLKRIALQNKIPLTDDTSPQEILKDLVPTLAQQNQVVILIDEYDYPILEHITRHETAALMRDTLKGFYTTLKSLDRYLQLIFITGVSKFSRTSIFSGLNNLDDISESPEVAELLGYTDQEVVTFFEPYLKILAQESNESVEDTLEKIRIWYDGYRFFKKEILTFKRLFNPHSVLHCLRKKSFENYWFASGTPSYLINLIKTGSYDTSWLENFKYKESGPSIFGTFELDNIPLDDLLYHSGYLTIKSYYPLHDVAKFVYPNSEVQDSMEFYLLSTKLHIHENEVNPALKNIRNALQSCNLELFCKTLETIFAHIPYNLHIKQERYYHSILQSIMILVGKEVQSEILTDKGRIDMVIETDTRTYLFEFKFEHNAQDALKINILKNLCVKTNQLLLLAFLLMRRINALLLNMLYKI